MDEPEIHYTPSRSILNRCRRALPPTNTIHGLSKIDAAILKAHIHAGGFDIDALFTRVPLPMYDDRIVAEQIGPSYTPPVAGWARSIDAVIDRWAHTFIVEIKPSAAYVALGQALYYTHWAAIGYPDLQHPRPAILTDAPDPMMLPVAAAYDVTVWGLPGATYVPIGRPT